MKQYVWFHPEYVAQAAQDCEGQKENFKANGYIVLNNDELKVVRPRDHLTIIGASIEQTGDNIQGDNAEQCAKRLNEHGLAYAPGILTLECGFAAIQGGLAQKLSQTSFFKYSVIEANLGCLGRSPSPRPRSWSFSTDNLGRSVLKDTEWFFYVSGYHVATYNHKKYNLEDVLAAISPKEFHATFFAKYNPGWRGGRVGRYCKANKTEIKLPQALFFANESKGSATSDAVDATLDELFKSEQKAASSSM